MKPIIAALLFFAGILMADLWVASNGGTVAFRSWILSDWIEVGLMAIFLVASAFVARSYMRERAGRRSSDAGDASDHTPDE
ncbi:MAG TPA: hypothetical protein VHI13_18340 [Candidatus Kapabacteria bacterium]|nr:hypothetical protein [Candidatus Kapabacteria bacterium]